MLSIIICSRSANIPSFLNENIKETIGCAHELVVIDNSTNQYSIFEAYNQGIKRSKGEFLCFIHDDINIQTNGWGKVVKEIFLQIPEAGLLGIAGGKIKTKMPSAWWDGGENVLSLVQHHKNRPSELWNQGFDNFDTVEVATIDGVFMVMRRDKRIMFDERLKGFHNYDIYLSLKHHAFNKKVIVTNKILLEHFSEGSLNKSWYKSTSLFHKFYKSYLPIVISGQQNDIQLKRTEFKVGLRFTTKLIEQKSYWDAFYWGFEIFKLKLKIKYYYRLHKLKISLCSPS
jgi:glycosyltransferase involved in cell wall biosynthesis